MLTSAEQAVTIFATVALLLIIIMIWIYYVGVRREKMQIAGAGAHKVKNIRINPIKHLRGFWQ